MRKFLAALALTVASVAGMAEPASAHSDCSVGVNRRNAAGQVLSTWSHCKTSNPYRLHRPVIWCQNVYGYVVVDYGNWANRGYYAYGADCPFAFWGIGYGHQHTN